MHESPEDIAALQDLLDRSYARAGTHLLRIHTPERRLEGPALVERLTGMVLLALATSGSDGTPVVGAVDGVFFRGSFYFGSAPDSLRFRHIARRPEVSAVHLPGEEFAVTVHGRALPFDIASPDHADFRRALIDVYTPLYGPDWEKFLETGVAYARIEAERMFAFGMPAG